MLLYCFLNSICKIQFLAVINFYFIAKAFFSYWQYFVRLLQPCSMRHLENFFYYFGNNNQRKCNCVECCFLSKKFLPGNLRVEAIRNKMQSFKIVQSMDQFYSTVWLPLFSRKVSFMEWTPMAKRCHCYWPPPDPWKAINGVWRSPIQNMTDWLSWFFSQHIDPCNSYVFKWIIKSFAAYL